MKVLILEDNQHSREALEDIVMSCGKGMEVFSFDNRADAMVCAMENYIDVFLIDIILKPEEKNNNEGIGFADMLRDYSQYKLTPIIFITTLQGLETHLLKKVHCYDYIEKPIGDGSIVKRHLEEVLEGLNAGRRRIPDRESIPVRHDGIGYEVFMDDVIYVTNRRGILTICMVDETLNIPHLSTKKFMSGIKYTKFFEPTYGTIINARYIEEVDFRNNRVKMKGIDDRIPIGGRMKKAFREDYLNWQG